MFAQTFCDSSLYVSRKKWTTLTAFAIESLAVAVLITVPLFHMETMSPMQTAAPIFTPILTAKAAITHPDTNQETSTPPLGNFHSDQLRPPQSIPYRISMAQPEEPAPTVPWGTQNGRNPISQIITGSPVRPIAPAPPARPTRVSMGVMEGALIEKIQPVYPRSAIITRTEGDVILQAIISRQGTIENLQVISGNPFLSRAAVEAVRQWRYRPYRLDGVAVEVETQITVKFTLSGN